MHVLEFDTNLIRMPMINMGAMVFLDIVGMLNQPIWSNGDSYRFFQCGSSRMEEASLGTKMNTFSIVFMPYISNLRFPFL